MQLTVWPVKITLVEQPASSVTVNVTVWMAGVAYVCVVVAMVVVWLVPSAKSH